MYSTWLGWAGKTKDRLKWNSVVWLLRSGDRHRRSFAELDERRRRFPQPRNPGA